MGMSDSDQTHTELEIERLSRALDAETQRCLEFQGRLDRACADFEEFISVAVHNLREPLRDVASFSQLVAETCASRLDPDTTAFLARIQEGAARMQSLLADVVDYSAVGGGGEGPDSRTDMEAALCQALLSADSRITAGSAEITHDPLPEVTGDFEILSKVLKHLIVNAIEYCDKPRSRIHISSRRENSEWVISVRDNGPGIEPEFQERVFGVFKRLHGREHPGTGLGLAFCRRAIEWHGGRISVESKPGAGSTFHFTVAEAP